MAGPSETAVVNILREIQNIKHGDCLRHCSYHQAGVVEVILIQHQVEVEEELRWREVVEVQDFVIVAAAERPADSIDSRRRSSGSPHKPRTDPNCRSIEHIERCSPMRWPPARPVPKDSWRMVAGIADLTAGCHNHHSLHLLLHHHHRSDDRRAVHTLRSHDAVAGCP